MKTIKDIWQFELDWSLICHNNYNNMSDKPELREFIKSDAIKQLVEIIPENIILALGRDGTMLDVIRAYHDDGRPFLWINFGSKGFLLIHRDWITKNAWFISMHYPLLEVKNKWEVAWFSFNDICLYSPSKKVIELEISQQDVWSISLKWDGTLVSTPAWSTWHSESYGARPMPHDTDKLIITPLWDEIHRMSKVIHNNDNEITIRNTWRKTNVKVNLDGTEVIETQADEDLFLEIRRIPKKVRLLISQRHKQDWDNRIMNEQWFN